MKENLKQSVSTVLQSMEQLNHVFEVELFRLEQEGAETQDLRRLEQGVLAMKDAGRLYLTWADHFIERMGDAEVYEEELE
ncbi:hypothetical protein MNBD_NITROSPIRAE01-1029 [hydrothermal vent metagenome]|uniref:Uncharacterized protein n=1 Tax=hydrothermal vent metagenome TaxID=652676 RepID=A0A3B1CRU2_9ZZZZ